MKRRDFLRISSCGVIASTMPFISNCANQKLKGKQPNIIFIMADDLGYGHLGCYGQKKIRTPNIDRFAAEGMRFTQCYAGSPVCAPSRSVLMTGLHQGHTSVRINPGGIPLLPEDITVGEVLKQGGYTTGIFGKWGLGDKGTTGVPNKQGFDEFFGYLHQVHCHFYYPYYLFENEQKFMLPGNEGGKQQQYTHDVIMEKALEFIRSHKDSPFFLFVPFTIPHTELLVPEDSFREYEGKFPEPNPYIDRNRHYADQAAPRTTFAAMITRMDRDIGRMLDLIKQLNLDEDTIIFFTSDNGGQGSGGPDLVFFNGNGTLRGAKGQVYEGGIRVPMIARWPGRIEAGTVNDYVWAFWDVMPTLAEFAGVKITHTIDGISALPALLGEGKAGAELKKQRFLYWEHPARKNLMQAVRMGDWKVVRLRSDAPLELYNLKEDISEKNNVASQHPEITAEIEEYLKTASTESREYPKMPQTAGLRKEETGYIR
ncbi:arylsulfatase [candidate division KSB1 bacterium]